MECRCRYVLRPPFAQERRRLRADGRVEPELKTAWHGGTRELVFEPLEPERLATLTPRPETNRLVCNGLHGARARWRFWRVVTVARWRGLGGTLLSLIRRRVTPMEAFAAPVHAPDFKSGVRL